MQQVQTNRKQKTCLVVFRSHSRQAIQRSVTLDLTLFLSKDKGSRDLDSDTLFHYLWTPLQFLNTPFNL